MKQKVLGLASALSIALFGAVLTLYVLIENRENRKSIAIDGIPLVVRHATLNVNLAQGHWTFQILTPLPEPQIGPPEGDRAARRAWAMRFVHSSHRSDAIGFSFGRNFPDFRYDSAVMSLAGYSTYVVVPCWFVLAVASILPLRTAFHSWRRRRRERKKEAGLCVHCGYDLRASSGRCPECGAEIEAQAQLAKA